MRLQVGGRAGGLVAGDCNAPNALKLAFQLMLA
jgi:hypothetical protein